MKIKFSNPKVENKKIEKKLLKIFKNVLNQENYILNIQNKKFESNLKKYFGVKYALGVKNGTDALKLSLQSLNLKKNDEVIIPSLTATATGSAVVESGGTPVIVDVDETANINHKILSKIITKKTKAIIVVHLHGNMAKINEIKKIAKGITIIEDCAQSFGSKLNNKKAGTFGKIACFSFYPTKNLSAIGDGGAIITNDKIIFKRLLYLRQYGWDNNRISVINGSNSRLDELQAGILNLKINSIDKNNIKRNNLAKNYLSKLKNLPLLFPKKDAQTFHNYHLFVALTNHRNKLIRYLNYNKIYPSIHYKFPLHKMPTFKKYKKTNMKITEEMSKKLISLPMYPDLKLSDQQKVINVIKKFFKKNGRKKNNNTSDRI